MVKMKLKNPFTQPGNWYKANLHAHTTNSDGKMTPTEAAEAYRQAGYNILALTDHNITNDVSGLSGKDFLVVNGTEYECNCPFSNKFHHIVAIGLPRDFWLEDKTTKITIMTLRSRDAQKCINKINKAGAVAFLAHPLWSGHRYEMYKYLRGIVGVEVYNSTTDRRGRSNGEVDWTHMLDAGWFIPALAVDDSHTKSEDLFRGWVNLKMKDLTEKHLIEALRTGCYYSSTGPRIIDFRVYRGVAQITCSPAAAIYFIGSMNRVVSGACRKAREGKSIRKFSHPVNKDWLYVRAVVVDHAGRKAWTNPIAL